jgi:hypothetical protein
MEGRNFGILELGNFEIFLGGTIFVFSINSLWAAKIVDIQLDCKRRLKGNARLDYFTKLSEAFASQY